jgi:hypothetical protein
MRKVSILLVALAGCAQEVDVPALGDYTQWASVELRGPAPGHGDGVRVVYANDQARAYFPDSQRLGEGAVLVKEVYDGDEVTGAPSYLAIMRRCAEPFDIDPYDPGGCDDYDWAYSGWLFTETDAAGGAEVHHDWCWGYCHQSAPYEGAFLDYTQLPDP